MTKREILIREAHNQLIKSSTGIVDNGKISSPVKGYIASLGGSIVQAGLLQSIIFFEAKTEQGRKELIKAIFAILKNAKNDRYGKFPDGNYSDYLLNENKNWDRYQLTTDFVEAAVALKMAMRLYPS